jgi:beta-barrel assembly-enhancing protease
MKKIHDSLLIVATVVCCIMIPLSAQTQSDEPIAAMAGSSDTGSTNRRHGDVQNIGNRNVPGRIMGVLPNLVSLEKEIALGQQMATELEQTVKLLEDPVITEYIDRLGQNLVRHSDAKVPFHIKVVNTDEANAVAFPGGFLYVNKGLILEAESESELAGVMVHEIAHVCARHTTRQQSKKKYLQLTINPAVFAGDPHAQTAVQNSLGLGIDLELLGITRESESEADQLGIQYLWNTGYDPNAFVSFFEKMQAKEKSKPGRFAGFFRTHPSPAGRITQCLEEQRALPEKDLYITSSPEFDRAKARLLAINNAQRSDESEEK